MPRAVTPMPRLVRAAVVAALLAGGVVPGGVVPDGALAQPRVSVRAQSRLELRASGTPGALRVEGALRDDLGAPLGGRRVDLELRDAESGIRLEGGSVTTGTDGSFAVDLEAPAGECIVSASFPREALYDAASAEHRVDVRLAPVDVTLELPGGARLDLDVPSHPLSIVVRSPRGAAALDVELATDTGASLGRVTTDAAGHATATLESARLGAPSAGRIVATTRADLERAASRVELAIVRFRATTTTLTVVLEDDDLVLSGGLSTSAGPQPDEAISILAGEELLGTTLTDDGGRFSLRMPRSDLDGLEDPVALRARFESDAPWLTGSESSAIEVRVGSRLPSLRSIAVVLSLAIALALVLSTLRRPAAQAELALARSSVVPSARAPGRHVRLGVRLRDARTRAPIAGAEIRLTLGDGTTTVTASDETGRAEATLAGRCELAVTAPGYEVLRATIGSPHRGEWLDAELRLSSLRDAAAAPLRSVAERALGSPDAAAVATGREVLAAAERRGPAPALGALVARVERAAYGAEPPTHADVDEIRAGADTALGELERGRQVPPGR